MAVRKSNMEGVVMRMARVLAVFLFVAAIPASGLAQDTGNVVPKKAVSDPQEVLKYLQEKLGSHYRHRRLSKCETP